MNTLTAVISGRRRLMVVELVAKVVLAFAIGLATSIALAGVVLLLAHDAQAAELVPMKPKEVQQGTLLLKSEGAILAVPAVATEAEIEVSGIVARAVVKQTYRNPFDTWFEGIYVFPLPENAAVDHLRMKVGERIIEGDIQERQAARAQYEQAKSSGRRAALVEQERPNIFTTSVANIPPRGEIVVEIEYQQTLRYDSGSFSLRFPMVVGPRYIPGTPAEGQGAGTGWAPNTDQVPDAARITPPVLDPARHAPSNPVRLKVVLDAGVPLARVDSPYHAITQRDADGGRIVELAEGSVPADKDFELKWTPAASHAPQAALFTESKGDKRYALLMVMPPAKEVAAARLPREVVFVIDTSGSMEGVSIVQAREALLTRARPVAARRRFNVIEFNSIANALYPRRCRSTRPTLANRARQFVSGALPRAAAPRCFWRSRSAGRSREATMMRQVVFLTDGAVGNEDAILKLVHEKLGDRGCSPSASARTQCVLHDQGCAVRPRHVHVHRRRPRSEGEDDGAVPQARKPGAEGTSPSPGRHGRRLAARVPDLYAGEPVVVSAQFNANQADGEIRSRACARHATWGTLPRSPTREEPGVGVLWARAKIASLIDSQHEGAKEEEVRDAVVDIALAHHLVSKYTSLVAVDKTPVRPKEDALQSGAIPTNLPEGWEYGKVFGELPQGATDSLWNLLAGLLALLLAIGLAVTARRTPVALRSVK
jgi:Ca-activated chloride channel family protein